jgi:DNA-binding XRE family transcriptional regulator
MIDILSSGIKSNDNAQIIRYIILNDKLWCSMNIETNLTKWAVKIGNRLRTRRKEVGLSLTDLSRLSGSTASTLSHIERGTRDVKLSTLVALADALRVDLADLVAPQEREAGTDTHSIIDGYDLDDDA